jgi:hypothetical protein
MKSRVIQDEPEPTDLIDAPAATGASHGDKELKMEAIATPARQADGRRVA